MFDFGNKKLIEDLKREVKFQNNLVGVGLAIQDELKKKNEILEKEKIEYQKTVEYLTNKIDELNDKIKKLEEEIENEKIEKEEWHEKWDKAREYKLKYTKKEWSTRDDLGIEKTCFSFEDVEYVDITKNLKKVNTKIKSGDNIYKLTYFKLNNDFLTTEYLKEEIKNKRIPMYQGIPFRKLQDLYKIMTFLESEKYVDYHQETDHIDFTNKIIFKNKIMYFNNVKINDKNIKFTIDTKRDFISFGKTNVELYRNRNILIFNDKEFKNVKELMKLMKEKCYKNKELLEQFL